MKGLPGSSLIPRGKALRVEKIEKDNKKQKGQGTKSKTLFRREQVILLFSSNDKKWGNSRLS
jgi:hypothetical protein